MIATLFDRIQNQFLAVIGWEKVAETSTCSGVIAIAFRHRRRQTLRVALRKDYSIFQKMNFSDYHPGINFYLEENIWRKVVEFSREREGKLPKDFDYSSQHDRVFAFFDSLIFSIPIDDIIEIDQFLNSIFSKGNLTND